MFLCLHFIWEQIYQFNKASKSVLAEIQLSLNNNFLY